MSKASIASGRMAAPRIGALRRRGLSSRAAGGLLLLGSMLFGFSPAIAADEPAKPRIAIQVEGEALALDADATAEILRRRLETLGLGPKVVSGGGVLRIEIDQPDDLDTIATVVTTPGRLAIHAAGEIVQTCPETQEPGKICMPTIEPRAPFVIVTADPVLSGAILEKAVPITGDNVVPQVAIQMTKPAADVFAQFTKAMEGGRIAFAVDGRIITAPRIQGQITSGGGVLAGPGIPAATWATILNNPPLPGTLSITSVGDVAAE